MISAGDLRRSPSRPPRSRGRGLAGLYPSREREQEAGGERVSGAEGVDLLERSRAGTHHRSVERCDGAVAAQLHTGDAVAAAERERGLLTVEPGQGMRLLGVPPAAR